MLTMVRSPGIYESDTISAPGTRQQSWIQIRGSSGMHTAAAEPPVVAVFAYLCVSGTSGTIESQPL